MWCVITFNKNSKKKFKQNVIKLNIECNKKN